MWILLAVVLLPLAVVVITVLVLRKPLQRRWYSGTGISEWSQRATGLPWADRFALYKANVRGKPTRLRLASLAVERGEVMLRVLSRMQQKGSAYSRLRIGLLIIAALNMVFSVLNAARTGNVLYWFQLGIWVVLFGIYVYQPQLTRRTERKIRLSVGINRGVMESRPS